MDDHAERTRAAIAAGRRASAQKRRRAWAAFNDMAAEGHPNINFTTVARRADVSTDLLYRMDDLAVQIKHARDRGGRRRTERAIADVDRSDLANERARGAHLTQELQETRKRLALAERAIARGETPSLAADASEHHTELDRLRNEVARLDGDLILARDEIENLRGQLRDREESEQAARELSRDYFRELQSLRSRLDELELRPRSVTDRSA